MSALLKVALIGCGKSKLARPAPARELYTGQLFRAQLAHAERLFGESVLVLSARHGVVALDDVLEPYDERMQGKNLLARGYWGETVCWQLLFRFLDAHVDFYAFAGEAYVRPLRGHREWDARWELRDELAGLQALPPRLGDGPLVLAGRSTGAWRERVGNGVPVAAARAWGSSMLQALLASRLGTWQLGSTDLWVAPDAGGVAA